MIPACLFVVDFTDIDAGVIITDLSTISEWAEDCLVKFNVDRTISVLISRKHVQVHHLPLYMIGLVLTERGSRKHVGITLSKSCT